MFSLQFSAAYSDIIKKAANINLLLFYLFQSVGQTQPLFKASSTL